MDKTTKRMLVRPEESHNERRALATIEMAVEKNWRIILITKHPITAKNVGEPEPLFDHYCHWIANETDLSPVGELSRSALIIKVSDWKNRDLDSLLEKTPSPLVINFTVDRKIENVAASFQIDKIEELNYEHVVYDIIQFVSLKAEQVRLGINYSVRDKLFVLAEVEKMRNKLPPRRRSRIRGAKRRKWYKRQP